MAYGHALRTHLGDKFNEGARQLWLIRKKNEWSVTRMAREAEESTATFVGWLYGDRRPGLEGALKLQTRLGIDPALWNQAPAKAFALPTVEASP